MDLPESDRSAAAPLAVWLFAMALLATLTAVAGAYFAIDGLFERHERSNAQELLRTNAESLRDALDEGMAQHFQQVKVLGQLDQVVNGRSPAEVRRALDSYRSSFPQYAWLGLADTRGEVFASAGGLLMGANVSKRGWFQAGLTAPYVGDVHQAILLAKLLPQRAEPWRFVDFSVPVLREGKLIGVLGAHLSWGWAASLKQTLAERLRQPQTDIFVLDAKGEVLLGPKGTEGSKLDLKDATVQQRFIVAAAVTHGYKDYKGMGWEIVLRQPQSEAMAGYRHVRDSTALAALAVSMLLVPGLWLGARRFTRPLRDIAHTMQTGEPLPDRWTAPYREADVFKQAFLAYRERQLAHNRELRQLAEQLEQRVAERTAELALRERQLRDMTNNIPAMVGYFDVHERCVLANDTALRFCDVTMEAAAGRPLAELLGPANYAQHRPHVQEALAGRPSTLDGSIEMGEQTYHFRAHVTPEKNAAGAVQGFYIMTFDVTALKKIEQQLSKLARFDPLTGLPNRRQFEEKLQQAVDRSERSRKPVAVLFLDVDKFKAINDTHGHAAGDEVLKEFALRLTGSVRKTDTVARLAGDEFVIIAEGLNTYEEPQFIARKIIASLSGEFDVGESMVKVSTSIGIAIMEGPGMTPAGLLATADRALYEAKAAGRNTFRCGERSEARF